MAMMTAGRPQELFLMPRMNTTTHGKAKGFTLIEVLVTMLIVSIGIFSILAVITVSLRLNSSSVYRTIASEQTQAMAETLRANAPALGSLDTVADAIFAEPEVIANDSSCWDGAGGCARNGFIAAAIFKWREQLAAVLPSGTGTVCRDGTPRDGTTADWQCDDDDYAQYVVKVCWDESRIAASSSVVAASGVVSGTGGALCTSTNL
jgi:type IV pilus assembly protein PilV